jgi:DNA-binding protein H-NS
LIEERLAVQGQLNKLNRLAAGASRGKGIRGRLRGAVAPKYRNPENPAETWAGRGLKPRWLAAALKTGKKLEDFSISAPPKKEQGGTEENAPEIDGPARGIRSPRALNGGLRTQVRRY